MLSVVGDYGKCQSSLTLTLGTHTHTHPQSTTCQQTLRRQTTLNWLIAVQNVCQINALAYHANGTFQY